ncbi:MAG: protein translocase subunit SecD [Pirellulales bacterium]|nr:protein translocase subunit SecD [Pirellulales bacterium]
MSAALLTLLLILAALVLAIVLGVFLANALRMPDYGWKISLVLVSLFLSAVLIAAFWPPKFGIDLSGGVTLIYEIDKTKVTKEKPINTENMAMVIDGIKRRVNPGGQKEIIIRQYGQDQVEIIIPEQSEAEADRVGAIVSQTGQLEFRILANNRDDTSLINLAKEEPEKSRWYDGDGNLLAWFVPIREGDEGHIDSSEVYVRKIEKGKKTVYEALVRSDLYNVTGEFLSRASSDYDQETASPCVLFTFNTQGGLRFGKLTGNNLPDPVQKSFKRKLGIILDNELYSAPYINSKITDHGQITGNFSQDEVDHLVYVLNAGALPLTLDKHPVQRLIQGPTLGADTIRKSLNAMMISSILVPLFMLWYYRFSGIIANLALVLNIAMLLAIMLTINARFTLPGLAGVALTIGMAVDNNVLIYERLREEIAKGSALRMAIRNAFQRASATIVDANLTTILAAVVLYVIGTDQIKGFAVTLFLGVSFSMYTAVFVSRVIFDIAERHRWITKLKMVQAVGHLNINFMRVFPAMMTLSLAVIVLGLALTVERGKGLFDIDFTGGTSVQIWFRQPQKTNDLRVALSNDKHMPDLAITDTQLGDEERFLRFTINTSNTNEKDVENFIREKYGKELVTNQVTIGPITAIEEPAAQPATPSKKEKTPEPEAPTVTSPPPAADAPKAEVPPAAKTESLPEPAASAPKNETPPAKTESPEGKTQPPAPEKHSFFSAPAGVLGLLGGGGPTLFCQLETAEVSPPSADPPSSPADKANTAAEEKIPAEGAAREQIPPAIAPPARKPASSGSELTNPFLNGSSFSLDFMEGLEKTQVESQLTDALKAAGITPEGVQMEVTNPKYYEDDRTPYQHWDVRLSLPPAKTKPVLQELQSQLAATPLFPASNKIGGAVAISTRYQAIYALVASWVLIIIYLWVRFQGVAFGVAAVAALIHDVLIMLAAVTVSYWLAQIPLLSNFLLIEQFKINLPMVAAFLTIIGYSVNDTIVVFDRVRETRGKDPNVTRKMVNDSINQTLSRTIITSLTVLIVVVVLYFFGGQALRGFAFALIVGVVSGTYSSIYIASPVLLWLFSKPGDETAQLTEK